MHKINIITHRGLEPGKKKFAESSYEAFANHLKRGFGIEFDVNFSSDKKIFIFHDETLARITSGTDKRKFEKLNLKEIKKIKINKSRIADLDEILNLIKRYGKQICAMHLKGGFQEKKHLNILIKYLENNKNTLDKFFIFDVKISVAKYLKTKFPKLMLAPSVAHKYDIERYNSCVNNTLISLDEAIDNKNLFDWVWLDEWDLNDADGKQKTLYNQKVFDRIKKAGFKISLVTPELHASSPGLLGGEAHQDAKTMEQLDKRLREIIELAPDAICTDYPNLVRRLTLT